MKKAKKFLSPKFELELISSQEYTRVVGIDEVGRGCWAGPVAVGAYVFEVTSKKVKRVIDSKMLNKLQREEAHAKLSQHEYLVSYGELEDINSVGVGKTIEHLIQEIIQKFNNSKTFFLIDGQFAANFGKNSKKFIRGDSTFYSIAAASILAKVERDRLMEKLDLEYPEYGFARHKGYGTKAHREALARLGVCNLHRTSYIPIQNLLKLHN